MRWAGAGCGDGVRGQGRPPLPDRQPGKWAAVRIDRGACYQEREAACIPSSNPHMISSEASMGPLGAPSQADLIPFPQVGPAHGLWDTCIAGPPTRALQRLCCALGVSLP